MHASVLKWTSEQVKQYSLMNKKTLEVGSLNVNGSVRPFFTGEYHGIDIQEGAGVDEILDASQMEYENEYDVIVCTEMLEHAEDWRAVINNIKRALTDDGILLLTARGPGFGKHDYPGDYWRFTVEDMDLIFSDIHHKTIKDQQFPGVFVIAWNQKREDELTDLSEIEVESI